MLSLLLHTCYIFSWPVLLLQSLIWLALLLYTVVCGKRTPPLLPSRCSALDGVLPAKTLDAFLKELEPAPDGLCSTESNPKRLVGTADLKSAPLVATQPNSESSTSTSTGREPQVASKAFPAAAGGYLGRAETSSGGSLLVSSF
jgi:hypothetical protein